jgi:hypothetical protein
MSFKKTPPPLCDFMQWPDTEQSDFDKWYIEGEARDAREWWFRMVEWEKRGEKKEEQKEMRHRQEMREREVAQAHEVDRERKREMARRAKEAGWMPSEWGNTPVVLSRPRVLVGLYQIILDFMTLSTRALSLYP